MPPPLPGSREPLRRILAWMAAAGALAVALAVGLVVDAIGEEQARRESARSGPGYSFLRLRDDGAPVRWNPCRPIHYETNLALAHPGALADIQEAIRRTSEATGIVFVWEGPTSDLPSERFAHGDLVRGRGSGARWSPLLIAWVDEEEFRRSAADLANESVALGVGYPVRGVLVSGYIAVNADLGVDPGFGPNAAGVVVMHELGHVLGLGHVPSFEQLMFPGLNVATDWGDGDREGLARLGHGAGCLQSPDAGDYPFPDGRPGAGLLPGDL